MSSNPFDEDDFSPVVDCNNEAIRIAFDVKDHTICANNAGLGITRFNVSRTSPIGLFCFLIPGLEGSYDSSLIFVAG
jgi:hypothetical protein